MKLTPELEREAIAMAEREAALARERPPDWWRPIDHTPRRKRRLPFRERIRNRTQNRERSKEQ